MVFYYKMVMTRQYDHFDNTFHNVIGKQLSFPLQFGQSDFLDRPDQQTKQYIAANKVISYFYQMLRNEEQELVVILLLITKRKQSDDIAIIIN